METAIKPAPPVMIPEELNQTEPIYNRKGFLAPESINSLAAIHCKLYPDGKAIIRVSDCHNSIRIWNEITDPSGLAEMLEKIYSLKDALVSFETHLKTHYNTKTDTKPANKYAHL